MAALTSKQGFSRAKKKPYLRDFAYPAALLGPQVPPRPPAHNQPPLTSGLEFVREHRTQHLLLPAQPTELQVKDMQAELNRGLLNNTLGKPLGTIAAI